MNSDRSGKSSTAASGPKVRYEWKMGQSWVKQSAKYLGGKSLISLGDSSQKRNTRLENNSHSSMESADSRSSNFVFVQGASYSSSSREPGGRTMMDYNGDNSDQDAHTSTESVEESEIKNNGSSDNLDPLTEAFNSFHNFQEALKEELQKFQDLGKEPISLLHDRAESNSCIHAIQEEKTLAEINQAHKMLSKLGEAESKAENLKNQAQDLQNRYVEIPEVMSFKKRIVKTTSCLLLQLGLLLMVFSFQLMPESENVVPT